MLNHITEDIFNYQESIKLGAVATLPNQSTVVRLNQEYSFVYSPGNFDDGTIHEIAQLAPKTILFSPNTFHHMFAEKAQKALPQAELYYVPALEKKHPDWASKFHRLDIKQLPESLNSLQFIPIGGMPVLDEVAVFHEASGTLMMADCLMNMHNKMDFFSRLMTRLTGTYHTTAVSRLVTSTIKDRAAAKSSYQRLNSLPIKRVIMSHGNILQGSDLSKMTEAFSKRGLL